MGRLFLFRCFYLKHQYRPCIATTTAAKLIMAILTFTDFIFDLQIYKKFDGFLEE